MSQPFILVSCGQYTEAEKSLGRSVSKIVKVITGMDAFFAEDVHDLNGLDASVLGALRDAVAFITVIHPRGKIIRPDGTTHVRASVWIEQEIAIATYIQRVDKRPLPVIAFIHESVGREGLRDLLHLNPIQFSHETEVLTALPECLLPWRALRPSNIDVQLQSSSPVQRDGHWVRQLAISLINETNKPITNWSCCVRLPTGVLKHWSSLYPSEDRSTPDTRYRVFRFSQDGHDSVPPHSTGRLITFDYCTHCAADYTGETPAIAGAIVGESLVEAKFWIDGKEYSAIKMIKELSASA